MSVPRATTTATDVLMTDWGIVPVTVVVLTAVVVMVAVDAEVEGGAVVVGD